MIFSTVANITQAIGREPWWLIYDASTNYVSISRSTYIYPRKPELNAKERTRKFTSELNKRSYHRRSRHEDVPRGQRLRRH
jgi:hypothetical protein